MQEVSPILLEVKRIVAIFFSLKNESNLWGDSLDSAYSVRKEGKGIE